MWKLFTLLIFSIPLCFLALGDVSTLRSDGTTAPPPPTPPATYPLPDWSLVAGFLSGDGSLAQPSAVVGEPYVVEHARILRKTKTDIQAAERKCADIHREFADGFHRVLDPDGQLRPPLTAQSCADALKEYSKLEIYDQKFKKSLEILVAWLDIQKEYPKTKLEGITKKLSLIGQKFSTEDAKTAKDGAAAFVTFRKQPFANDPLVAELARTQGNAWTGVDRLFQILKDLDSKKAEHLATPGTAAERIQELADLLNGPITEELAATIRRIVGSICEGTLPKEKLSEKVTVVSRTGTETALAKNVEIHFKTGVPMSLEKSRQEEKHEGDITRGDVRFLLLNGAERNLPEAGPPLLPTKYNSAILAYNTSWDKINKKWDKDHLAALLETIKDRQQDLKSEGAVLTGASLMERIETILGVFVRNDNLSKPDNGNRP